MTCNAFLGGKPKRCSPWAPSGVHLHSDAQMLRLYDVVLDGS